MSSIALYLVLLGTCFWLPGLSRERSDWLGFRYFLAAICLPLGLYIGNVIFVIPLTALAWIYAGAALGGIGAASFRNWHGWREYRSYIWHPVVIFPVLLLGVALYRGGIEYLPYPGDEVASWLRLARQIFLADAYWSDQVVYHLGSYTNGWPLTVAFSNIFDGHFSDENGVVFLFFFHVGLLGFVYDLTRWVCRREGIEHPPVVHMIAWLLVLGLLTIEASWIVFPLFQMIEKPLLYAFLGGFLIAWAGQYDEFKPSRIAAFVGMVAAAGYLLKITMLVFMPAMGVLWLSFYWRDYRRARMGGEHTGLFHYPRVRDGLIWAALMLVPTIAIAASWTQYRVGSHCFASPIGHFFEIAVSTDQRWQVAQVMTDAAVAYFFQYKLPLTLTGGAILAVSLVWPRTRWFIAMLAVFFVVYMVALHSAYYNCYSPFGPTGLQSFQRYFRPNLRLIHFFAPIIAAYFALQYFGRRKSVAEWISSSPAKWLGLGLIGVLLALQIGSLNRSLADTSTRDQQSAFVRAAMLEMKRDSAALIALIQKKGLSNPKVSVISQGGNDVAINLASYFGIKTKRGGGYFHYTPVGPFSWTPGTPKFATSVTDRSRLVEYWRTMDIIWPVNTDKWIREVLTDVVADPACAANPEKYFLFRSTADKFECVRKN